MKKLFILIVSFSVLLTACAKGSLKDTTAIDTIEKINNKETMILVIGSTTCSACIAYKETLKEVVKEYKVSVNEVYVDKEEVVSVDGKEVKQDLISLLDIVGDINATPTVIFIVEGEVQSRVVGAISYNDTIKLAKESGVIKE